MRAAEDSGQAAAEASSYRLSAATGELFQLIHKIRQKQPRSPDAEDGDAQPDPSLEERRINSALNDLICSAGIIFSLLLVDTM